MRAAAAFAAHRSGDAGSDPLGQQRRDERPFVLADHGEQEARNCGVVAGAGMGERLPDAPGLQAVEAGGEGGTLVGRKKQALAAVALAGLLRDPALIDQLLEHAGQALLGDLQDLEQVRDLHARMPVDEVQHAMVGAAEAIFGQHGVRLAREVAVGEEQQLDEGEEVRIGAGLLRLACGLLSRCTIPARERGIYVSHVDLFGPDC